MMRVIRVNWVLKRTDFNKTKIQRKISNKNSKENSNNSASKNMIIDEDIPLIWIISISVGIAGLLLAICCYKHIHYCCKK